MFKMENVTSDYPIFSRPVSSAFSELPFRMCSALQRQVGKEAERH